MGNRVKRIRTKVSEQQMKQAIVNVWNELFGKIPSNEQIAMVLAQNSLETGNRNSMWNYNVGNITTNGKGEYDFFDDLTTQEQMKPGVWEKKNLKYRSYPSLREGVKDYLKFISGKKSGYYTANEAPYTKAIIKLYNQYSKSKNNVTSIMPQKNNFLDNILNNYLQMVAASEKQNKKIYKKMLPINNILVKINSTDYTNSIEFSRILCAAFEEELMAKAYIYTDGKCIEIECAIPGPAQDCLRTTNQLINSVIDTFKIATNHIGGINIKAHTIIDKKSTHKQINFKLAEYQREKFLLKFM